MERILLGIPALAMSLMGNAQLAPTTDAPLYRHLLEVNKEWSVMDPAPVNGDRVVHFSNEAERIAMHLHLVAAYERAHAPEGLSASVLANRTSLLDKLDSYADRGRFPQNHVLPVRNPVFIDPHGTACAVGQLMVESGHVELAQRIHREMNLAYVHDMRRADVFSWAGEHGFSEDELAWIQPGYPPNIPWYGLGGGTNGRVAELLRLQNGDLIIAGEFSVAGGTVTSQVARWNGSTYSALGNGVIGQVTSAIEFEGDIYLGGSFGQGSADLARWTGSSWVLSSAFSSKVPYVSDLHVHNGVLYAAGATTGFAGTSYEVKRLVGGAWEMVGQQLNGEIRAMESFDGTVVCAGAFTDIFFGQDTAIMHVARLDGSTWEEMGNGLDGTVRDLLLVDGALFAAGDCVGEVATYFGLARIAAGASSWTGLMPNIANYFYAPLDGVVGINAMVLDPDGTRIHLGGDFYAGVGLVYGTGLATFNGSADDVAVLGEFMGPVNDLELLGTSELVAGGSSESLTNIASTDLALAVPREEAAAHLVLWPNPAVDRIRIDGAGPKPMDLLEILDATGRVVRRLANVAPTYALDVSDLPIGGYTMRITADNKVTSAAFVKR
ncbi:MAG: T9SS type A sorting domain-containing protein [Flavobacteriales bacterium]|nr:T9SS type A sorting domain-containing protein [Flavobacteriales bacterium]